MSRRLPWKQMPKRLQLLRCSIVRVVAHLPWTCCYSSRSSRSSGKYRATRIGRGSPTAIAILRVVFASQVQEDFQASCGAPSNGAGLGSRKNRLQASNPFTRRAQRRFTFVLPRTDPRATAGRRANPRPGRPLLRELHQAIFWIVQSRLLRDNTVYYNHRIRNKLATPVLKQWEVVSTQLAMLLTFREPPEGRSVKLLRARNAQKR